MKIPIKYVHISVIALLGAASASADELLTEANYADTNSALIQSHAIPRYKQLAVTAKHFADSVDHLCDSFSEQQFDVTQNQYHQFMDAWMGVQHLNFGPIELYMRNHRFYFWPQSKGKVAGAISDLIESADGTEISIARVAQSNVAAQGLLAAEYLLFENSKFGVNLSENQTACNLLRSVSDHMHAMASEIVADWQGGGIAFAEAASQPGPGNLYFEEHKDVTKEFIKSFHDGAQLIAELKVQPMMKVSADKVRPHMAESNLSGRSLRNIIINLQAAQALYIGEGGNGLGDLVAIVDTELDQLLRKALRLTLENATSIGAPLEVAAADPDLRPGVEKLFLHTKAIRQIVRNRLAPTVYVSIGFNSFDGD